MGCGASKEASQPALKKPAVSETAQAMPGSYEHQQTVLLAEAQVLLKRLPPYEAAAILATLRDSSTPVAALMKEEVARQTPA